MNKLREDVRVVVLGGVAALFTIGVTLLVGRIDAHYTYLTLLKEANYDYVGRVENLWWMPFSVWHLLLSVAAALLVHRYLAKSLRSPFVLWVITGTTSLLGWGLSVLLVVSMDCMMRGAFDPLTRLPSLEEAAHIAKYVSTAFASTVLYASMMTAAARQYAD